MARIGVAEAAEKFGDGFPEAELHLIGHIQRNKAKRAVEIADAVQSLDSIRTLHALEKHAAEMNKNLKVLFEVNTSGEESKQGVWNEAELYELIDAAFASACIKPAGLMTMAPFTPGGTTGTECLSQAESSAGGVYPPVWV